jgi:hypothetical protein
MTNKEAAESLRKMGVFANKMADHIEDFINGKREKLDNSYLIYLNGELLNDSEEIIDWMKEIMS